MEMLARLLAWAFAALASFAAGDHGVPVAPIRPIQAGESAARPQAPRARAEEPGSERVEHFVLELVTASRAALEAPADGAQEVGLALLRKRRIGARLVLECELRFLADDEVDTRVHHVEVFEGGLRLLVWREYRPGTGRTLFVEELDAAGHMRSIEWGGPDGLREELLAPAGALFPLDLIERARAAQVQGGALALYEPLERRFEPLELRTRLAAEAPLGVAARDAAFALEATASLQAPLTRTVELFRADGSLAGAYRFLGGRLECFQWQAGSARARRVPAEVWRRRAERCDEADRVVGD